MKKIIIILILCISFIVFTSCDLFEFSQDQITDSDIDEGTDNSNGTGPWIDGGENTSNIILGNYGLGSNQSEYLTAAEKTYNWYMDQRYTGSHSGVNCGPTSVTMSIKWANGAFNKTPENAREKYRPGGGWWYTNDITNYLDFYNINNYTFRVDGDSRLIKQEIDDGKILIFCIDASKLNYNSNNNQHVDSFYKNVTGHFIVGKGYTVIDGVLYIEVYDPNSWGSKYSGSSQLKGKNRYLRWNNELSRAISTWWNYAIAVEPKSAKSFRTNPNIVDQDMIDPMPGGITIEP